MLRPISLSNVTKIDENVTTYPEVDVAEEAENAITRKR
jgi:hypothetical protein